MQHVKLVVVGDGGVGKSSFLICATTNHFPCNYVPTVFDNYSKNIMIRGNPFTLGLWDTAGQEDYDRLRPLSYPETDVFVVCFDVASRSSFHNAKQKWVPEVRHFVPEAVVLLLGNKTDLRGGNSNTSEDMRIVTKREGENLAASLGIPYKECSSLLNDGVQHALNFAVELTITCPRRVNLRTGFFKGKSRKLKSAEKNEPAPPVLPPAGLAPRLEVLTSSFASEWKTMMSDSGTADVRFVFTDGQTVEAHKTVLTAASTIFKNIFLGKVAPSHKTHAEIFEDISWVCNDEESCPNLLHIKGQCKGAGKVVIRMHESILKGVFMELLTFLYTGSPDISEDEDINFVKEIQSLALKFQLSWLAEYCTNILKGDSYLNPSIGTWVNDNTGIAAKKLFLNKSLQADVKFHVEDGVIYGHRVILKARSEVMAAMLGGAFIESDLESEIKIEGASLPSFLALLEYLYTDHAPIEEGDAVEIMVLADRFCLPRLVTLCELYITKKVDVTIQKRVADGTSDVINLLLTSQAHNADQLSSWCLHFIATNFSVFESTEEFDLVQGQNRDYVTEHRWPPLSYLKAQEEFERNVKSSKFNSLKFSSSKCTVM